MGSDSSVITFFVDPYLQCDECGYWVTGAMDVRTDGPSPNVPCGHDAGATSVCPSFGPVDGCRCKEYLGLTHAQPEDPALWSKTANAVRSLLRLGGEDTLADGVETGLPGESGGDGGVDLSR